MVIKSSTMIGKNLKALNNHAGGDFINRKNTVVREQTPKVKNKLN